MNIGRPTAKVRYAGKRGSRGGQQPFVGRHRASLFGCSYWQAAPPPLTPWSGGWPPQRRAPQSLSVAAACCFVARHLARARQTINRDFTCAWATRSGLHRAQPRYGHPAPTPISSVFLYKCPSRASVLRPPSPRGCVCTNERKRSSVCQPPAEFGCVGVFPCAVL